MTDRELRKWYNETFYDEQGRHRQATIAITFSNEEGAIQVPAMLINANNTIHQVIASFNEYLKAEPRKVDTVTEKPDAKEIKPPIDFGQVEYRSNLYIVEQTGEEDFVVLRKEDRSQVNPVSPTAKAIVKRFREK
jgi:hypothetical protein